MRLIGVCVLTLALAVTSACERRTDFCSLPELTCAFPDRPICVNNQCMPPECMTGAAQNPCPKERPVCVQNQCQAACTSSAQCAGFASAPLCIKGMCVQCDPMQSGQCTTAPNTICDAETFQCRGCKYHSECTDSKVCAKADLVADLPGATPMPAGTTLPAGTCVPQDAILTVDEGDRNCGTGTTLCAVQDAVDRVTAARPFVRVVNASTTLTAGVTFPGVGKAQKGMFLIGPDADMPPEQMVAASVADNPAQTIISVGGGYTAVLEGLLVRRANVGVSCSGAGGPAGVRLIRSVVSGTDMAALQADRCNVEVTASWIGQQPKLFNFAGNHHALVLKDSDFTVVNSVFYLNALPPSTFSGIDISDTMGRSAFVSRIVNSDLIHQDFGPSGGATSVSCSIDMSGRLAILNSYLYNSPMAAGLRHVSSTCNGTYARLASNEAVLAQQSGGPQIQNDAGTGFTNIGQADFTLRPDAPEAVRTGGQPSVMVGGVTVSAPATDLDGKRRARLSQGQVSIGAFEAP